MAGQPGKRQPRSRLANARRTAGGMLRVRRPTLSGSPFGPSTTGTMPASQQSLRAVSDAMAVRCSISQRPAAPFASTSALDMDDDFVPVRSKSRRIARFEHPLGHPRQRIGAAHGARWASHERPSVGRRWVTRGCRFPVGPVIGSLASARVATLAEGAPCRDVPRGTSSGAEPSSSHSAAGCSSAYAAIGRIERTEDATHGAEWLVRVVEMIGNSSALEYEPPPPRSR